MQFIDAGGDVACTYVTETVEQGECCVVECTSLSDEDEIVPLMLTREMARAVAADLLAFADGGGDQRKALAADLDSTITAVLANYTHAIANNGRALDAYDLSLELRDAVRLAVAASPATESETT
jgi:hypothetical protein